MKSTAFDIAKKYLKPEETGSPMQGQRESAPVGAQNGSSDILIDNTVIAVLFDWPLAGPFWLALRDDFISGDDIPIFFASELPHLRQMTPDELRRRYAEKRALGGGWIRDRIQH